MFEGKSIKELLRMKDKTKFSLTTFIIKFFLITFI